MSLVNHVGEVAILWAYQPVAAHDPSSLLHSAVTKGLLFHVRIKFAL